MSIRRGGREAYRAVLLRRFPFAGRGFESLPLRSKAGRHKPPLTPRGKRNRRRRIIVLYVVDVALALLVVVAHHTFALSDLAETIMLLGVVLLLCLVGLPWALLPREDELA